MSLLSEKLKELGRLARRIDGIREAVPAAADSVGTETASGGISTPPAERKALPPVRALRPSPELIAK